MYVINKESHIVNIWEDNEINRRRLESGEYGVVEYFGEVEEFEDVLYEKGYVPTRTIEEQNELIRQTRENLYMKTSDVIRNDYLEAVARGSSNAEQLKQEWLASKDKIREENPYIVEGGVDDGLQNKVEEEKVTEDILELYSMEI